MDPSSAGSVSTWLHEFKAGDREAAAKLFERYFEQLVALARKRLGSTSRRVADEEDVALSAFESFCRAVEQHQYAQLEDRNDLWKLLFTITERKAIDQIQSQARRKRGSGMVRGDSVFLTPGNQAERMGGFETFASDEPTPADAAELTDLVCRLFEVLDDPRLRQIAQMKIDGHTNEEIGKALKCSRATVERRLGLIRTMWEQLLQETPTETSRDS